MVVTISQTEFDTSGALLSNVTWETLEKLDADLAQTGARLTYLDGCLEIMTPFAEAHEEPRNTLGSIFLPVVSNECPPQQRRSYFLLVTSV